MLSPTKEEELAKQVTKMGENGPVIFDRHFFTMVRKYNTLPQNIAIVASSTQDIDRHHKHNFEWINFVREPVSRLVILLTTYLPEQSFNPDLYIRCQCSTT